MNAPALHSWIQSIAALTVVLGVLLVIYELRQSREAIMSQLTNDSYFFEAQRDLTMAGEDPAEVLAKACVEPDALTLADLVRLDGLYSHRLMYVDRVITLGKRGSFYADDYWKPFASSQFGPLFSTAVGRNYWKNVRSYWQEDLRLHGDQLLATREAEARPDCNFYTDWQRDNQASFADTDPDRSPS